MSQEWLKKLAELSNDKDLVKRAQQLQQQKAERRQAARQVPDGGRRRSLPGAAFGYFFRFLFLIGLALAAAMFVVANLDGLTDEPLGLIFHHTVWYPLTQPIFPAEFYELLRDWTGVTPSDLHAFYAEINPGLEEHQDILVFAVPAGAALALTLFFLPAINAGRRRSPIRFFVFLANLAVVPLAAELGGGSIVVWLAALVFSFIGGRGARIPQAPPRTAPSEPDRPARPKPQPAAAVAAAGRPRRAATVVRREPIVVRRSGGGSWVRAR